MSPAQCDASQGHHWGTQTPAHNLAEAGIRWVGEWVPTPSRTAWQLLSQAGLDNVVPCLCDALVTLNVSSQFLQDRVSQIHPTFDRKMYPRPVRLRRAILWDSSHTELCLLPAKNF